MTNKDNNSLTELNNWKALIQHRDESVLSTDELFKQNTNRTKEFSLQSSHWLLDFSHNAVNQKTLQLLHQLADEINLRDRINDLFSGQMVNNTEQRPALHHRLRSPNNNHPENALVQQTISDMSDIVEKLHQGKWLGYSGKPIKKVVNLGIGGSNLGPRMVTKALEPFHNKIVSCQFVSNLDNAELLHTLESLNPETTVFIISSKSFTTEETLYNAEQVKQWLIEGGCSSADLTKHFIAITAKPDQVKTLNFQIDNVLPLWDWVGGRFSLWSSIGLPIAIATSMETFNGLLDGAHEMDQHFQKLNGEIIYPLP